MKNPRGNSAVQVIIAVVVTALALVGVGYYFYNSQIESLRDEVKELQTKEEVEEKPVKEETQYQNSKYGFSFDYDPDQYFVSESKSRGGATGEESDLVRLSETGETCPAVDIFVSTATLEQELSDLELRISGTTTKTTVDNMDVTKRSGELTENIPPCGAEVTGVVFEQDGNVFVISAFKKWENVLDEVLESIDFKLK